MKRLVSINNITLIFIVLSVSVLIFNCKKTENPIKFPHGTFPDTAIAIEDINSAYDDYNTALYQLNGSLPIIFSSNRKSAGAQFDLEQGIISFTFSQTDGTFEFNSEMANDPFMTLLISAAETPGDDFGPYRVFSTPDGYEYFIVSSVNTDGNLDLKYFKNLPVYGTPLPAIDGPHPVSLLNTNADDAYLCFNSNFDSAYFISNIGGNFDIYLKNRPANTDPATWFNLAYSPSLKVDSINSISEDKCPMVFRNFMIFSSNSDGGLGGYDLYYSVFRNGNWSSPVNCGPKINTSANEYRPVIGFQTDFTNFFMIFSSDRPGGKGGFDLYFTGIDDPSK